MNFPLNRQWLLLAGATLFFILGMAVIYFTPLKYAQLIEPKIKDVSAAVIREKMKENPAKYDFIDVRSAAMYEDLHAENSRSVPLHMMYFEREKLPKKGKQIVLICSGGVASGVAFMYLQHFGFSNVVRIAGGIEAWQAANLPVQSQKK